MATWLDELKTGDRLYARFSVWNDDGDLMEQGRITPDQARAILKILEASEARSLADEALAAVDGPQ